jgi:methylmalonyl-CoA epimerase
VIKHIDHIGVAVRSIEETLRFYEEALGLKVTTTEAEPDQRVVVAFLPAGESEVELVEPIDENGPVARFIQKRGEGIHHICFEVTDLEATLARLEERGVQLIDREPYIGTGGKKIAFIHPRATHGVLVELYEKVPDEKRPPKIDLGLLRERLLVEGRAAQAGVRGFLDALQKQRRL